MAQTIPIGNDNRKVVAGNTITLKYTIVDSSNVAVNLTSATLVFGLSRAKTLNTFDGTSLVTKSSATGGITITAPTAGKFTVTLTASDTAALEGVYYYEIKLTDGSGNVTTLVNGPLYIQPNLL
jgi:hypothetical protein